MRLNRHGRSRLSRSDSGQTLVEFALVIPIFLTAVIAVAEFSFLFATYLSASFASRDGVQVAAEAGSMPGSDCSVILRISNDLAAPADRNRISSIEIFWSDSNGNVRYGKKDVWQYGAPTECTTIDGTKFSVPFYQTDFSYPESERCNVNGGIGCAPLHDGVDTVGVTIKYDYGWITPFPSLVGGGGPGPTIVQSNMMRMEPVR